MICFHGTPFSGTVYDILPFFKDRNFLISMQYPQYGFVVKKEAARIILDNGAYTIWKKGKGCIDISKYTDFVKEYDYLDNYSWCFIPDTIEGTVSQNDKQIETWLNLYGSYKSVPVWHYHEPLERLYQLSLEFPVVALGSSAEYSKIGDYKWMERTKEIFNYASTNFPKCKLHGLRMLNKRIFTLFPYYSGDSTNVGRNIEFYRRRHRIPTRLLAAEQLANSFEKYKSTFNYEEID
jgi:hypothetical protein